MEGYTIDKLVNLIATVKGEHGKLSKELEDEEKKLVDVSNELMETEKGIMKSQKEEKGHCREVVDLMVVVEELEAEEVFYHEKKKELEELLANVEEEISQMVNDNQHIINELQTTLVSLQKFENDLAEKYDIEKVLLENSYIERDLLKQSKGIEELEEKFKRNKDNESRLKSRVDEIAKKCRASSEKNAEQEQVIRDLMKERDLLRSSKDTAVCTETKQLREKLNAARQEKRNFTEVLECMQLEASVSRGMFIAEDLSDEEYAAPPRKQPAPVVQRQTKEITLTRKKRHTPNTQRGNNKKGATFRDLFRSNTAR